MRDSSQSISPEFGKLVIALWRAFFAVYGVSATGTPQLSVIDTDLEISNSTWWDWGEAAALLSAARRAPWGLHPPSEFAYFRVRARCSQRGFGQICALESLRWASDQPIITFVAKDASGRVRELCGVDYLLRPYLSDPHDPNRRYLGASQETISRSWYSREVALCTSASVSSDGAVGVSATLYIDARHALSLTVGNDLLPEPERCRECGEITASTLDHCMRRLRVRRLTYPRRVGCVLPIRMCTACGHEWINTDGRAIWHDVYRRFLKALELSGQNTLRAADSSFRRR
jgi:hypothetical protein